MALGHSSKEKKKNRKIHQIKQNIILMKYWEEVVVEKITTDNSMAFLTFGGK